jgi:hypothetical protein
MKLAIGIREGDVIESRGLESGAQGSTVAAIGLVAQ